MRSQLYRNALWKLGLFLFLLIEPTRCGVPPVPRKRGYFNV